jgi:hypothetical protein
MRALRGEENMLWATVFALGGGHLKKNDVARLRGAWQRDAFRERRRAVSKEQMKAALAEIGIGWRKT